MIEWRVSWCEGTLRKYRYYKDDFKAILHHIKNLKTFGIFYGASLCFRDRKFSNAYVPIGGCDSLLGLTYHASRFGKPKEYWVGLIQKAKTEVNQSSSCIKGENKK